MNPDQRQATEDGHIPSATSSRQLASDNGLQERYSRQMMLDEVGFEGQQKLFDSSVAVVGAGGLGSPAILYLAAAGVGRITIIDHDQVSLSNLQRQILFGAEQIGEKKTTAASQRIRQLNPNVQITGHSEQIRPQNVSLLSEHDFVVEATDSLSSKFLVSDFCALNQIACNIGGIWEFEGQIMTHVPGTACYRCIFRDVPAPKPEPAGLSKDKPDVIGVIGYLTGIVGSMQASQAIQYILDLRQSLLTNCFLHVNLLENTYEKMVVAADPECRACSDKGRNEQTSLIETYNYQFD